MKSMLKTLTSNISFNQREKSFFHRLEEGLMNKAKMNKSACYKQSLLEYHAKLMQSAVIR